MQRYNPKEIEPKWQKIWDETGVYKVDLSSSKPKYVAMGMFNYPSGAGIHIGHAMNYTISDVKARFMRQLGHESYHPVGWDAFGLPAENYAIKAGVSPQESMATIIPSYHKQYKAMGWSNDWSKEIATHEPIYYKWTQWIFAQMFKHGLAYQDARMQWWCEKCQTVLANEQIIDGKCWRHEGADDPTVEKKEVKQWFFKITEYADELLEATDALDWTESVKLAQKNWIGKSVGAEIDFAVDAGSNYVLLHGYTATSKDGFFPWLSKSLTEKGCKVYIPDLPNTDNPDADEQAEFVVNNYKFDKNTVLLGHSYGSISALKTLERLEQPIKRLVLVAGFAQPGFKDHTRPFEETTNWDIDFEKVKANVNDIIILRPENDTIIPEKAADFLQSKLGGRIVDFTAQEDHVCGDVEPIVLSNVLDTVRIFTTRPDTLFGATFIVLAPEHELVSSLTVESEKSKVESYIKQAQAKSEVERQASKEKTGVFTGAYAINPANDEKIPIWIADYVLTGYGTGAIMAVPAHDDRDFEFAQKFGLPITFVVEPTFGEEQGDEVKKTSAFIVLRNPKDNTAVVLDWGPRQKNFGGKMLIGGTVEDNESFVATAKREIVEETGYTDFELVKETEFMGHGYFYSNTKNHNVHTSGKGLLFDLKSDKQDKTELDHGEKNKFEVTWEPVHTIANMLDDGVHEAMYRYLVLNECYHGEGVMVNSGKYDGMSSSEAREKIVADLAGSIGDDTVDIEYTTEGVPVFIQKTDTSAVKEGEPFVERQAIIALVKHWKEDKYIGLKWKKVDWQTLITGGVDAGQSSEEAATREIQEETGYKNPILKKRLGKIDARFFHVPKNENRLAHFTCFYFELADGEHDEISEEEQKNHDVMWLTREEMMQFKLPASQRFIWDTFVEKPSVAREKVNYKMRDWSVSRQRYWGAPIPIINCPDHGPVLVPDDQLPVVLPELDDFKPSGDGRSALARATEWLKADCPTCGKPGERETDTLDTYICSSWYMFRYFDPTNDKEIFDSELVKKWEPIDFYNGADHATAHLLYARFVTRFFAKLGLVNNPEPFKQFLFNGKVTAADGQMFSKSLGNGVDPLDIIEQGYGADALRTYLMFAAPLELWAKWDPQGVPGTHRFLSRVWNLVQEYAESKEAELDAGQIKELQRVSHQMIKKMTEDIENNAYNTAIATAMGTVNDLYKLKTISLHKHDAWQQALEAVVACIAPFAPHVADELWQQLGHKTSVHVDTWPKWDDKYLLEDTITIAVQVNGKVRGEVQVPADAAEDTVIEAAKANEKVAGYLDGQTIKKAIYVRGRLVSFVV